MEVWYVFGVASIVRYRAKMGANARRRSSHRRQRAHVRRCGRNCESMRGRRMSIAERHTRNDEPPERSRPRRPDGSVRPAYASPRASARRATTRVMIRCSHPRYAAETSRRHAAQARDARRMVAREENPQVHRSEWRPGVSCCTAVVRHVAARQLYLTYSGAPHDMESLR